MVVRIACAAVEDIPVVSAGTLLSTLVAVGSLWMHFPVRGLRVQHTNSSDDGPTEFGDRPGSLGHVSVLPSHEDLRRTVVMFCTARTAKALIAAGDR